MGPSSALKGFGEQWSVAIGFRGLRKCLRFDYFRSLCVCSWSVNEQRGNKKRGLKKPVLQWNERHLIKNDKFTSKPIENRRNLTHESNEPICACSVCVCVCDYECVCAFACAWSARFTKADTVSLERNTFLLWSFACKGVSDIAFFSRQALYCLIVLRMCRRHMRLDIYTLTDLAKNRIADFVWITICRRLSIRLAVQHKHRGTFPFKLYVDHDVLNQSQNSHSAQDL